MSELLQQPSVRWRGPDEGPTTRFRRSAELAGDLSVEPTDGGVVVIPDEFYAEVVIGANNLRPIAFLERGIEISRAVARVNVPGIGLGTGFLIGDDLLLTNNHVLGTESAARSATIEFHYEDLLDGSPATTRVVRCNPDRGFYTSPAVDDGAAVGVAAEQLDFTVVRLAEAIGAELGFIPLDPAVPVEPPFDVLVIQHPGGEKKQISLTDNEVVYADELLLQYLSDTMRGSSGSPVFNDRWELVGLHHAGGNILQPGDPQAHLRNEAIRISAIVADLPDWAGAANTPLEVLEADPIVEQLHARSGFETEFLGPGIVTPLPVALAEIGADIRVVHGRPFLPYEHFSLAMSVERRMARWVAWNIDGGALSPEGEIGREGIDFRGDPRLLPTEQLLGALYSANMLDRGHIARRADLLWGELEEAERANDDSFFFPNITPQMSGFNQSSRHGLWGLLENDLLGQAEGHRISVLGGPVFRTDDLVYRGARIPREFWKLFVYVLDGTTRAKAFLLTQELGKLEVAAIDLPDWEPHAIPISDLAQRTSLDLAEYAKWERGGFEAAGVALQSVADFHW